MTIDNSKTLERIKILTELHGAPGFEDEVRSYMKSEMEPYVDKFIQNKMGGFYGIKKSNKENAPRVMIAAHMDEVGFMITHINDNGMIQFTNLGGVANDIWQGQRLKIKNRYGKEIIGVVANIPKHFRTGNESIPQIKDLMLDIGASSSEDVRNRGVEVGDTIVPHTIMTQLSKNRYSAKAWDNRYGCVLAIEILELLKDVQLDVDLYVGANVQEEVGLRGAKAAAKQIDPDIAFVVDCSPANDIKGKQQLSGVLGEGTLIRIKDGTMILKPLFRDYLLKLAEENQIAYQYYISPGGTDGGEIHKENEGIPTAVIGVCARYIHSTDAVFDIRDYFSARHLLKESLIHLTSEQIQQLQYGKEF
ncbi:M42 family metallopeptidase [Staphylococcus epidermidis]|uniref:M42 family metallopeptidase n=1 Tax=Staphylococcus epidermidis TaxID=1282 RepID=UPI0010A973E6|nr:M42 family metallopeptidase [Staphylococcus epidermidis]MCG1449245.1 M42 family metallopeptidase [Staphylococcus epidermidis]MCG2325972.1 M42 family metallopeptidase [Staphylococcus epidermidis]MCG2332633.1 M42 family metallopeptidase [Staphylococcus epidermidis]MCG2354931.1 M42 family metallopeptidase [Staphylococcus epidermidis]MCG2359404.1 M42 family metallopeptidase [Staphylococcus epidermidis]